MCIVCGSGGAYLSRAIVARNATARRPRFAAEAVAPSCVRPLDPNEQDDLAGPADVILRGGPILTMAEAAPVAEAIAVRVGRIQAVGGAAEVLAHRGRLTRVIDLGGRALLPGFVNAHWHMPFTLLCEWVVAGAGETPEAALVRALRQAPAGEWVVLGASAASAALDAIAPSHPVVVADQDGAILAGNRLAAAEGALPSHISALLSRFPVAPGAVRRRLAALLHRTAAEGVTCLRICGLGTLAGAQDVEQIRTTVAETSPLRLRATLDAALLPEWTALQLSPGFGDDCFRIDTISAWPGDTAALRAARASGWQVTMHAADAGQVRDALDVLAAGELPGPRSGLECRTMPDPAHLAVMQRLGLSLGLTAGAHEAAVPWHDLPALPVSLGLDVAAGPAAPLRMVQAARAAGVPLQRSLAAVTIDAARRCGADAILGSLERGKYADLVFLDRDPRACPGAQCCGTWVNGQEIHSPARPNDEFRRGRSPT